MNKTNIRLLRKEIAYMINAIDLNSAYKEQIDTMIKEQGIENVFANLYAIFTSHEDTIQSRNNIMRVINHQSL